MKLYKFEDIDALNDLWYVTSSITNWRLQSMISDLAEEDARKLNEIVLVNVNQIANQGIQSFNIADGFYVRQGKVLPLVNLSSAERIFAIATIADFCKQHVYFSADFWSLSLQSRTKFYDLFHTSEYVNFVAYALKDEGAFDELSEFVLNGGWYHDKFSSRR